MNDALNLLLREDGVVVDHVDVDVGKLAPKSRHGGDHGTGRGTLARVRGLLHRENERRPPAHLPGLLTWLLVTVDDRRHIARICELVEAVAVIVLCVATLRHAAQPALIYAMVAVLGLGRAFESPAQFALLPNVVPTAILPAASARVSTAQQVSTITGPATYLMPIRRADA